MQGTRPSKVQIKSIAAYLEREFPQQVRGTWWDRKVKAQVFEVSDEESQRYIMIDGEFLQHCGDCGTELRHSELADYIRESRSPARSFRVLWHDRAIHILSKPL